MMRLSIYDLFTVGVVRPAGGRSKGRCLAFIEEGDRCVPLAELVIPNDLDDAALAAYVSNRFTGFARPGKHIVALGPPGTRRPASADRAPRDRGAVRPALQGVQH
jgi:hypothetical protein